MRFIIFVLVLLNLSTSNAIASQDERQRELVKTFIEKLINGQTEDAITSMFSRNNFLETRKQEIELLILNTEDALDKLGKTHGYDFARVELLSPNVRRYIYQIYYEQQPVHLSVILHKSQNKWDIITFKFNSNLSIISPMSNNNHRVSEESKALTDNVMSGFVKFDFADSLSLSPINCNNVLNDTFIKKHVRQMNYLANMFGKPIGYDLASVERISPNNNRFIYFLNLETYPVTVIFDLYRKPNGSWCAISYNFNDQFKGMEAYSPQ